MVQIQLDAQWPAPAPPVHATGAIACSSVTTSITTGRLAANAFANAAGKSAEMAGDHAEKAGDAAAKAGDAAKDATH